MPQLRHACHRDLQYISDVYSIFGLCLSDGNCQANSHQAPFDATTRDYCQTHRYNCAAWSSAWRQLSVPTWSSVKSFKSVRGRQRVDTAPVGATVQQAIRKTNVLFPHWRWAAQLLLPCSIDLSSYRLFGQFSSRSRAAAQSAIVVTSSLPIYCQFHPVTRMLLIWLGGGMDDWE